MFINHQDISESALDELIKEYILREPCVSDIEEPIATHFDAVKNSVKRGDLVIVYSQRKETAWLTPKGDANLSKRKME